MLSLVVARDRNGAIGKDGDIPWNAPEDLAFFQRETTGGAIIMGRNTWESLPYRPLKNRLNIVVSSREILDVDRFASVSEAIEFAKSRGHARLYGIGGAGIYREMIEIADRLLITEVDLDVDAPDTFFPAFQAAEWVETSRQVLRGSDPRCMLVELMRSR
ncbi:dihydrofolate reductase [Roseovarius pelagicus]|uniref:Dihydrofolate reductase n=1 Tax=Roseovarius pelagicus TaxID=2980108 RepID=A0ABY6D9Y3_9RHOB|nr:dihydrofolate reductase [Roseovarius pelagicus]UXX82915.1 dihydrofolate reductase [Roseovarius pelagicus]